MQTEQFRALVKAVVEQGHTLTRPEARELLGLLLAASSPTADNALAAAYELPLAGLLAVMARRGETAEELCGFAEAMRAAATSIPLEPEERARLVDTCGTGGDGLDTFNISTAAGLVAAGAGAWIAKHGNRAVTSRCGSADVLEALGVPIGLAPSDAARCLRATRFLFMLAASLHPAMRRVNPVRRALPFRTVFNLAGPLANPAGASAQVVGVYAEDRIPIVAEALRLLGARHAWVVHGRVSNIVTNPVTNTVASTLASTPTATSGETGIAQKITPRGLDELTVTGQSAYARVQSHELPAHQIESGFLSPSSLGLTEAPLHQLQGGATASENAALIEGILTGHEQGPRREIVLLNAGAALIVAGRAPSLPEGIARAAESIDSGQAHQVLQNLRSFRPSS